MELSAARYSGRGYSEKQDDHEEGEELTPDELMLAAKNKFDTMKEKGIWKRPTARRKDHCTRSKV
jgi:hypothetical protein